MKSISEQTNPHLKDIYEADEHEWLWENVKLIDQGRVNEIDHGHIKEFLEDMAKRDQREVSSRLKVLLKHLLKWKYKPNKRTKNWKVTIVNQRDDFDFDESGTLKSYGLKQIDMTFKRARRLAGAETDLDMSVFPEKAPFSFDEIMNDDFFPD